MNADKGNHGLLGLQASSADRVVRGRQEKQRAAHGSGQGCDTSTRCDLGDWEVTDFDLDNANEAVAHAAAESGPFRMTVIRS